MRQIDENGISTASKNKPNGVSIEMENHTNRNTVMSFHNISYEVAIPKSPFGTCRSKDSKTILTNVK